MQYDILLVNPNRIQPPIAPLALEYLAYALEKNGFSVALADLCFSSDPQQALTTAIQEFAPSLIALTLRNSDDCFCATQHSFLPDIKAYVAVIRSVCSAPVIIGGAGFCTAPQAILAYTGADYGLVGDGEEALVQFLRLYKAKQPLQGVPGLIWREAEGFGANPPFYGEFGQEPLPRDFLDNRRYFAAGGQGGLETKRGCPMKCIYCADPLSKGRRLRLRPPEVVAQEAWRLVAEGVDAIHLCDSEFNLPLAHAKDVCRAFIAAQLPDKWRFWAYLAPVPFDEELAKLLKQAGCVGVNFGADSGDPQMLRRLGRPYGPEDLRRTAQLCRRYGLHCMFDLLLGGPGETRESLQRTIALMKKIGPDCVGVSLGVRLYANTPLARFVQKQGVLADNRHLRGQLADNEHMAWPVYYLEAGLGEDIAAFVRELIGGDERFFFGWPEAGQTNYNYDDNAELMEAIQKGARGAYWDILRQRR